MAPTMAMIATAAPGKFRMATLSGPNIPETNGPSQRGNAFDCRMLSMTILIGQGSRISLKVSPSTAMNARVRAFQWGRMRRVIFNLPGRCEESFVGLSDMFLWFSQRCAKAFLGEDALLAGDTKTSIGMSIRREDRRRHCQC